LERLAPQIASRILTRIESLAMNARPAGCRMLTGPDPLWRIRIGDYRVLYEIRDEPRIVDILAVRHRSDAYR
jgi:mRNA interferase RelE/StbE